MHGILPGLFLGNSQDALNIELLHKSNIKFIVCAAKVYAYFPLLDNEIDNILLYVDLCHEQITSYINTGSNVLVHCQEGVSRSVALVTGFVMKRDLVQFEQAYAWLCTVYSQARVASNFASQLHAFGAIYGWSMQTNSQVHRLYRARNRIMASSTDECLPVKYHYSCRKCRESLFLDTHIIPSSSGNYAIECMQWMNDIDSAISGPLRCPRCFGKIGEFNWSGLWGNVPGFVVTKSKVDQMTTELRAIQYPKTRF